MTSEIMTEEKKYPEMNEEEKAEMWDKIADWFALPEEERKPKLQKDIYTFYQIPERTFYDKTAKPEFQKLILKKCLNKTRRKLPEVLKALRKKAESGSEKAIEMFLEYVVGLMKRLELSGNRESPLVIKIQNYGDLSPSQLEAGETSVTDTSKQGEIQSDSVAPESSENDLGS